VTGVRRCSPLLGRRGMRDLTTARCVLSSPGNRGLRGVVRDKMLVVHVQNPEAPNLDLLDTPGLVQFGAPNEPENMSAVTRVRSLHNTGGGKGGGGGEEDEIRGRSEESWFFMCSENPGSLP
jgi:hypothetical protein